MQVSSRPDPKTHLGERDNPRHRDPRVLLALEWRYRRRRLRFGAALLALAVLFFHQPNYTRARRKALGDWRRSAPSSGLRARLRFGRSRAPLEPQVKVTIESAKSSRGAG